MLKKTMYFCALIICLPAALMGATLTVENQSDATLLAKFKDFDHPYHATQIPAGQSHDFSGQSYFSVTVYPINRLYLAITSEQYSSSLGFRPERAGPQSYCNGYRCLFTLMDAEHGQLTISALTKSHRL